MKSVKEKKIQRALLGWYANAKRSLPWRLTRDPYAILVSEVMLQQTQVDRVIPYFQRWLKRWPTMNTLANARRGSVIKAWSGLGYNRRAVNLHRAAQQIMRDHGGRFPTAVNDIEALPGVGHYTARAVASFAWKNPEPFIDTNIRRVMGRVRLGHSFPTANDDRQLLPKLKPLISRTTPDLWHHALMDLGAAICKPKPFCEVCPLQPHCRAYPRVLSATRPKRARTARFETTDRFWRGRIIAALVKQSPQAWPTLRRSMDKLGHLSHERLQKLLADLDRDQLIQLRPGAISLAP